MPAGRGGFCSGATMARLPTARRTAALYGSAAATVAAMAAPIGKDPSQGPDDCRTSDVPPDHLVPATLQAARPRPDQQLSPRTKTRSSGAADVTTSARGSSRMSAPRSTSASRSSAPRSGGWLPTIAALGTMSRSRQPIRSTWLASVMSAVWPEAVATFAASATKQTLVSVSACTTSSSDTSSGTKSRVSRTVRASVVAAFMANLRLSTRAFFLSSPMP